MQQESTEAQEDYGLGEVARWVTEIKLYEKESQKWVERSKKIIRRYKDERSPSDVKNRFNVLWSNIQTLQPALYAKNPKPSVERRFKDADDLGRVASDVLERSVAYFVDESPFGNAMRQAVLDRLLCGRGTVWVRYEPHFRDNTLKGQGEEIEGEGTQLTDDQYSEPEATEELYFESTCSDYVHWEDFGHNIARTWEEVYAGWRKAYLTREESIERFGEEIGSVIPLDYTPKNLKDEKVSEFLKKSTVYEIWDKRSKKVIWIHKDYPKPLDTRDDPLKLKNFFPFPEPLFSTLANDSLIPVPDYVQYQDQANELDELTARITSITKSIKVAGVYAADAQGVERLLAEGVENTLIPVDQWAMFAEKGGLKGVIELLPVKDIAQTLLTLYDVRERVKQDLYEITGLSDIIRGASKANETATAQQIKGNFATMRLDHMQQDVARFARDLVAIMTEIIANHFQIDTIKEISGIRLMTAQEKAAIQQQMQTVQATGQQPPPMPDEQKEMLENPTWEEVEQLFRSDAALHFRINIETDSTIKTDQEAEKAARVEFLSAVGSFMQQATAIQDPDMQVLMGKLLQFGIRGFPVGKDLESSFEIALRQLERRAENPEPRPDPDAQKLQAELQFKQQDAQLKAQVEQQKVAIQTESEKAKMVLEQQKAAQEDERQRQKMAHDMELEKLKAQHQMEIEMFKASKEMEIAEYKAQIEAQIRAKQIEEKSESEVE